MLVMRLTIATRRKTLLPYVITIIGHSWQFMDAYAKGLNSQQAAWAAWKYHGHHILPEILMDDLKKAQLT
jgi:hypothetical protein